MAVPRFGLPENGVGAGPNPGPEVSQQIPRLAEGDAVRLGWIDGTPHQNLSSAPDPWTTRPWGRYKVLSDNPILRHKVKLLEIQPGHAISRQYHHHRDETWVVVQGTIQMHGKHPDNEEGSSYMLIEGQAVHIAALHEHQAVNIGKIVAYIVEVQYGAYCGEDDIVRL